MTIAINKLHTPSTDITEHYIASAPAAPAPCRHKTAKAPAHTLQIVPRVSSYLYRFRILYTIENTPDSSLVAQIELFSFN